MYRVRLDLADVEIAALEVVKKYEAEGDIYVGRNTDERMVQENITVFRILLLGLPIWLEFIH